MGVRHEDTRVGANDVVNETLGANRSALAHDTEVEGAMHALYGGDNAAREQARKLGREKRAEILSRLGMLPN